MFNLKRIFKSKTFYSFCNQTRFQKISGQDLKLNDKIAPTGLFNKSSNINVNPGGKNFNIATSKFTQLLEVLDKNTNRGTFLYQRIFQEFREIFKINDLIINNKENAVYLIKVLVKLKIDSEKILFTRKENKERDCFEITQETPENYLLFSRTWEKVLIKANFALKDADLLFETLYQVPRTFSENIDMSSYTERFLNSNVDKIPVSLVLFLLSKMLVQTKKSSIIPRSLINSVIKRHDEIKNNLFDLGMLNFVYYQCLSRYYISIQQLNKWNIAQKISTNLENKFRTTEFIDIKPMLRKGEEEKETLFYELILQDLFEYIDRFERGEIKVTEKAFIQGLIYLFKSFSRFSIQNKRLCEAVDKYTLKYKEHLNLIDKFTLLMSYAKYLSVIPSFSKIFEEEIAKSLKEVSWNLKYKPKVFLSKSSLDNVFINEDFYLYIKHQIDPSFDTKDLPALFKQSDISPFSINQILEIFWYLGKTNTGNQSTEIIKSSNGLLNLCLDLYTKYQISDVLQSACSLSIIAPEGAVDWKKDLEYKLQVFAGKCEGWEPFKEQEVPMFSISSLYKNLFFIKLKYDIDTFGYFTEKQIEYFKAQWLDSIKRYRKSKIESKIYDLLVKHFRKNNINRSIQSNKFLEVLTVDIFIEPNIILEINGNLHFPKNSSLEIMKHSYFGNYLIKYHIYQMLGYKTIMLDYFEFEPILDNDEKLESLVVSKLKPYL